MAKGTCDYCGKGLTGRQTRFCCRNHARATHMREARERGEPWAQQQTREQRLRDLKCAVCQREYRGHPHSHRPGHWYPWKGQQER